MGNTWNYEIVLQEGQYVTPDLLKHILSLASGIGYNLRFPTHVIGRDGFEEQKFFNAEDLIAYMCSQGGCFTIWDKADEDILFTVIPPARHFSFGVQYNLREDRNEKNAYDLGRFFDIVCCDLKPHFAYSHDEWGWEFAFRGDQFFTVWENFQQSIQNGDTPPVLCWLTYMDKAYFERIPKAALEGVEFYKLTETEHGVFIQLADHPWNAVNVILEDGKYAYFRYE
jgi:hypothetical protein